MDHPVNVLLFEATYQEWGARRGLCEDDYNAFKREIQAGNLEI